MKIQSYLISRLSQGARSVLLQSDPHLMKHTKHTRSHLMRKCQPISTFRLRVVKGSLLELFTLVVAFHYRNPGVYVWRTLALAVVISTLAKDTSTLAITWAIILHTYPFSTESVPSITAPSKMFYAHQTHRHTSKTLVSGSKIAVALAKDSTPLVLLQL